MQSLLSSWIILSMVGQFILGSIPLPAAAPHIPSPVQPETRPAIGLYQSIPEVCNIVEDPINYLYLPLVVKDSGSQASGQVKQLFPVQRTSSLRGRILDAEDAAQGKETPLAGATICNLDTGRAVISKADGTFLLHGLPAGQLQIEYNGSSAQPVNSYASYRANVNLTDNTVTEIERPIYLMKIDQDGQVDIDPNNTTTLVNPNLGIEVTIPPNTVKDENGNDYDGMLSLSEVPADFTPGSLPSELDPGLVVTIQPMGLTFAQPAPVTFPNTEGLPKGSEVDLWSLIHQTGVFTVVGTGRVSDDGSVIETIDGGIQESSWHFPLPSSLPPQEAESGDNDDDCGAAGGDISSRITFYDGCLGTSFSLPSYTSLGQDRGLTFVYKTDRAYPTKVIPFNINIPAQSPVPSVISYSISMESGGSGTPQFIDTSTLDDDEDTSIRFATILDGSIYETGAYPLFSSVTSHYPNSSVSGANVRTLMVVNGQDSEFGAGWDIQGLQRLYRQENGRVLITEGSGSKTSFISTSSIFPEAPGTLALFEFNDNVSDLTDNGRDATLLGGTFVPTDLGRGLQVGKEDPTGIDWSTYANLLEHPYTVEMILTPEGTSSWGKLFSFDDGRDFGWYYRSQGIQAYSNPVVGAGQVLPGERHYIAFVSTAPDAIDIYFQGTFLGSTNASFTAPPIQAIFFRDDSGTGRSEQLQGIVDALRISGVTRTPEEIAFVQQQIGNARSTDEAENFLSPRGDYSRLVRHTDNSYTRRFKDGTEFHFDSEGLQTSVVDRYGNSTQYVYDPQNRLTKITDPTGQETILTYQGDYLQTVTDPQNRVTTFTHDGAGDLTQVTFPDTSNRKFGYDNRHLMTSETDARNETATREYNDYGQLIKATLPDDAERTSQASNLWGLPGPGEGTETNPAPAVLRNNAFSSVTDGEGRTSTYATGQFGEATIMIDPADLTTEYERDSQGNLVQLRPPSGAVYDQDYDAVGNLTSFTDQTLGGTTEFTYESDYNQITSITDPFDEVTLFDYDGSGNLTKITTPLGRISTFDYDGRGLITRTVDPLGTETTFIYDVDGNLSQVKDGSGAAQRNTVLTTTDEGYLDTITDPLMRVYDYDYDPLGRLTQESLPGGRIISYGYDNEGNLTSLTPPGRPAHSFIYNEVGLVETYTAPTITGGGTNQTSFTYNKAQEIKQITRPDGQTLDYNYDAAGRLDTFTIPRGQFNYSYDATSGYLSDLTAPENVNLSYGYEGDLLESVTWSGPVAGDVVYNYDAKGRTSRITAKGSQIIYEYDDDDMLTDAGILSLSYDSQNGLITRTDLDSINDSWAFNDFGELSGYTANVGNTAFFDLQYDRDALGRIITKTETISGVTTVIGYSYDAAGRLEEVRTDGVPTEQYGYDPNGNRTSALGVTGTPSYDNQDRLLTYGANSYSYTADGELLSKTNNGQTTTYDYDVLGNLMGVTLPDSTAITYLVDGEGRRVGKRIGSSLTQGFLYEDSLNPVIELDTAGNIVSRFVYGSKANVPDYMDKNGTRYRIISDHLGSARLVVDAQSGAIAQRLDYDAFGRVLTDTNPGFQPFGFAGGLYDPDTGLVRFGARDYDPETGRWTTKDPIGFRGNSTNLYTYALNDPINLIDPDGKLAWIAIIWAITEIGLSISDAISTSQTLADPCAGAGEKALAAGLFALGVVAPGGGYSSIGKTANNAADFVRLKKYLASRQQMSEVGEIIAGQGSKAKFRDAQRVADTYGGNADDWVKKSSSSYSAPDGTKFETHWVENLQTGQRVEYKTKFTGGR